MNSEHVTTIKWSVMIPTYNCAKYLEITLLSVLGQELLENLMQIEVIDDCSTKDNPEEVVKRIGKGRVSFYRQEKNVGVTRNFNTCIDRAKGELVHILHGDDYVGTDFYKKSAEIFSKNKNIGILITSGYIVNEKNCIIGDFGDYNLKSNSNDVSSIVYSNPIKTPAVVIRRAAYNKIGKFDNSLVHCADWEMWTRAINQTNVYLLDEKIAYYRHFDGNDTSKLIKKGITMLDYERTYNIFLKYSYPITKKKVKKILKYQFWYYVKLMISNNDLKSLKNYLFISYRYLNFIDHFNLLKLVMRFILLKLFKKLIKLIR